MADEDRAPLPCPWCGSPTRTLGDFEGDNWVECSSDECAAESPNAPNEGAAIAAWNRVARLAARGAEVEGAREVDVLFDGPPGHESGRFVECESPPGVGINVGAWVDRGNGMWALRLRVLPPSVESGAPHA